METSPYNKNNIQFAVLMACYKNDNPKYLKIAIESSYDKQTLKPNGYYIIVDGPVSIEIESILLEYETKYKGIFVIKRLLKNEGLGNALKYGISICPFKYIIRMDADDISNKDRFKKIISYCEKHKECDVIGSYTAEFSDETKCITSIRKMPLDCNDIYKISKRRSPVSHVSVLFKRDAVIKCGNYQSFLYYEDYFLWVRMIKEKMIFNNIPEVLVFVRTDRNRYLRKGCKTYRKSTRRFQKYLLKERYINVFEYLINKYGRLFVAILPSFCKKTIYEKILRRKPKTDIFINEYNKEILDYEK